MPGTTRGSTVSDILTTDVVTVSPNESIEEALQLLVEHGISALPVTSGGGRCVGILSATDLLNLTHELDEEFTRQLVMQDRSRESFLEQIAGNGLGATEVHEVMAPDVITVNPETQLKEAALIAVRNNIHRLVVVDHDNKLVGIISAMDMLAALAENTDTG